MLDATKDFISENPGLVTGLAASGGLGALGGAVFTNTDENDTAGEKFKKRLKNALLAGGLAAGAFGAGSYGLNKLQNALPEDDESPLSTAIHSTPVRALGGGLGLGTGLAMQNKKNNAAIKQVFGDMPMSKERLIEVLNDTTKNSPAMKKIQKAWGSDTASLRKWIERTGIDPTKIVDTSITGIDDTAKAIEGALGKNQTVKNLADKLKVNPEALAKAWHKAKANKWTLGATAAGLMMPEALSTIGSALSSLFGGSMYE